MRVLITGGYGCIGSWIAKALLDAGREVWIFDRVRDTHRLDMIVDPQAQTRIRHLGGDVSDPDALREAVAANDISHILHLAGLQVPTCRAQPLLGARVNVLGTLSVFEAALALKPLVARVVYASSAAVHGPPDVSDPSLIGDAVRLNPSTHYGAFKVCNELNARVYWVDHGISSVGLRPWTVYGVGRDFGVTSEPTKAIKALAAGRSYHISYGGTQDLQFVGDVAAAFVRALEAPFEGAEAFNIRGDVVPIEHFVSTLERVIPGSKGRVTHGDRQLPIAPNLDDSRLQAQLGPLPRTPLPQGVSETYTRFRSLRDQGRLDLSDLEPTA